MKTRWIAILLFFARITAEAQTPAASANQAPQGTPYTVISRSSNTRVWTGTNFTRDASGAWIPNIQQCTELAVGICHTNSSGDYVDSSPDIAILPDGSAAATNRASSLYFPGDIGSGVIRLITIDGQTLQAGPAFLALDDGTNTVVIGTVATNSVGQLISSNQILYPDIFHGSGFRVDLLATVRVGGFENDVIFREQLPAPASLGLGANARLQLLTEWPNTPEPVLNTNTTPQQPNAMTDITLHFGSATIGRGRAFLAGSTNSTPGAGRTPVYKSWIHSGGRAFLVESVPYARLAPQLQQLPAPTALSSSSPSAKPFSIAQGLPPLRRPAANRNRIQLAKTDLHPRPGVVLDYTELDDSEVDDFEFVSGTTYWVTGDFIINGTATFDGNAIIKFPQDGSGFIEAVAPTAPCALWNNDPFDLTIFTSADDNNFGNEIPGSSGNPITQTNPNNYYIWLGNDGTTPAATNAIFSYAFDAIAAFPGCNLVNCQFNQCEIAVEQNGTPPIYLENVLFSQCDYAVTDDPEGDPWVLSMLNVTVDQCTNFFNGNQDFWGCCGDATNSVYATNCIFANTPSDPTATYAGIDNGFYNSPEFGSSPQTSGASPFQSGISGSYYLVPDIPFINAGNTTADQLGLYEYTTQTNQLKETNSIVDLRRSRQLQPKYRCHGRRPVYQL